MYKRKFYKRLGFVLAVVMLLGQFTFSFVFAEEEILFQDDFSAGDGNWEVIDGDWSIEGEGDEKGYKKGDNYSPSSGFSKIADASTMEWTDYYVEADMTILAKDNHQEPRAEISARFHEKKKRYSFGFTVGETTKAQIRKREYKFGGGEADTPIAESEFSVELNTKYRVKGVLKGNKLEMWVDGEKVLEVVDDELADSPAIANGTVCLNNYRTSVLYDNIVVVSLVEEEEEEEPNLTDAYLSNLVLAEDEELENRIGWVTVSETVYSTTVSNDVEEIYIKPTVTGSVYYTLTVNGIETDSGSVISLDLNVGENEADIVISEEGKLPREFILRVTRLADLGEPVKPLGGIYNNYFGTTHAHTDASGSHGDLNAGPKYFENNTPEKHFQEAIDCGYHFYFITDHSQYTNTFTNERWSNMLAQAEAFTQDGVFVGIRGFEFSENQNPQGHMNVWNTRDFINSDAHGVDHPYMYNWLYEQRRETPNAYACFNHPGTSQYNNWDWLTTETRDMVTTLEVINGLAKAKNPDGSDNEEVIIGGNHYGSFIRALEKGWRVSPVAGLDGHLVEAIHKPIYRTGIVAEALTKDDLLEAIGNRRTYATYDKNLSVQYSVNGEIMGSVIGGNPTNFAFHIWAKDPDVNDETNKITKIEIRKDNGELVLAKEFDAYEVQWNPVIAYDDTSDYFYVLVYNGEITEWMNRPAAYMAPVWIDRPDAPSIPEGLPQLNDHGDPPEEPEPVEPSDVDFLYVPNGNILYENDFEDEEVGQVAADWSIERSLWEVVETADSKQLERLPVYSGGDNIGTTGFIKLNIPGSTEWTDYAVEADVTFVTTTGSSGSRADIDLRYSDQTIRYGFTLRANGTAYITKRNTSEESLASTTFDFETGRKYHVKGVIVGNRVEMWLDGEKILEAVDNASVNPVIEKGTVALGNMNANVRYDNIKVIDMSPKKLFEDDFEDEDNVQGGAAQNWTVDRGEWYITEIDGNKVYEKAPVYSPSTGFAKPSDSDFANWDDCAIEADITIKEFNPDNTSGRVELNVRYTNADRRYAFRIGRNNRISIIKKISSAGETELAYDSEFQVEFNRTYNVKGAIVGNKLFMYIDGEKVLEAVDTSDSVIESGTIALSNYYANVFYDNVKVYEIMPPPVTDEEITDIELSGLVLAKDADLNYTVDASYEDGIYLARVSSNVEEIYIQATVDSNKEYTLTVAGVEADSGEVVGPLALETGINEFTVAISEAGKDDREYIVTVKRAIEVNMAVDASEILVERERNDVGLCLSWITDSDKYEREYTMEEVLVNNNFGTVRWPMGTLAMHYVWNTMDENGNFYYPMRPRIITPPHQDNFPFSKTDTPGEVYNEMDFDEFLELCKNTGVTPVIMVNCGGDILADSTVSYEDLVKIAAEQVRYAKEVKGMTGLYWEIGNEVEQHFTAGNMPGTTEPERVQEYIRRYHDFYDAMIEIDPAAKIGVGLNLPAQKNNWEMPVIEGCREKLDFIVTHVYGGHSFSSAEYGKTYKQYLINDYPPGRHAIEKVRLISSYIDELDEKYPEGNYAEKLEILVTEWSAHTSGGWYDTTSGCMYLAIHNFEILAEMMQHPRVGPTHFWITRSPWHEKTLDELRNYHPIKHDNNALFWDGSLTTMGRSVAIMSTTMYNTFVKTETDRFSVRPYASMDKNTEQLTVYILNRENNNVEANVSLANYNLTGCTVEAYVFKGEKGDDPYEVDSVYTEIEAPAILDDGFSMTLDPLSVTVVKITPPKLFEISETSISKDMGVSVSATVAPNIDFEGGKAAVIFKLMRDNTVIGVYSSEQEILEAVEFNVQFHGYSGNAYKVKIYVWDKLDSSLTSVGRNLATPVEVN